MLNSPVLRRTIAASALLFVGIALPAQARIFSNPLPPPRLAVDAQTEALFEFDQTALKAGQVLDLAKKAGPGKLTGVWKWVTPEELMPSYQGAGSFASASKNRAEAIFDGLNSLSAGPFSIDVVMRWNDSGGYCLRLGAGSPMLQMGVLFRGPGLFELRVPITQADGSTKVHIFESTELYVEPGPVRFDEFYTQSLTFDGKDTFRVYIDGVKAFEGRLPEGAAFKPATTLAVGDVAVWKSNYVRGEIAAVRISSGERQYAPEGAPVVAFDPKSTTGWTFDAGTEDSPVEPGTIPLRPSDLYSDGKGFGWLEAPADTFDAYFVAGRYKATPEMSFKAVEHKILDRLLRDGAVMNPGEFFRANVPDGQYWVTVEVGHNRGSANISKLTANGVVLGEALVTSANINNNNTVARTARNLVTVAGGKGIVIGGEAAGKIPVKSIDILPYAPLPIVKDGDTLKWTGAGPAPAELAAVSAALAADDFKAGVEAAEKIQDPFLQAVALTYVLGQPKLSEDDDMTVSDHVRQLLLGVVRQQPGNAAARWLLDSNERFRHALVAYIKDGGDDVVFGSRFALWLATANQGLQLRPEDPEYWQARFLAGAGIWQIALQSSAFEPNGLTDTYKYPDRMPAFEAPGKLFVEVSEANPRFRISKIMHGEQLPVAADWKPPVGAPEWAVLQYQLSQRILETIHWWINERMDDRGLLGGGLGDDVEALRWWTPAVLLADDKLVIDGWRRMAETAWNSTGNTGYSLGMDDVEHSAEPTADPLPMLALMNFDTDLLAQTKDRLTKTTPIFRDIWTTVTPDGYRMFKGHHFNAKQIETEGDVPYNLRAIKPLLWGYWMDQTNAELKSLLVEYARSWRDLIMSEYDGKPKGIVPMLTMLDRQHAKFGKAKLWTEPGYSSYYYPTGYAPKVYELLALAYEATGDKSYFEPVKYALDALRKVPDADLQRKENGDPGFDLTQYPKGTFDWAIRVGAPMIATAGGTYRQLTGDTSYDDVLMRLAPPSLKFRLLAKDAKSPAAFTAAMDALKDRLNKSLAIMNANPEVRTTMVQSTDRIFVPGSLGISAMATGLIDGNDLRGSEIVWPTFQITWQGTEGQVSVLVVSDSPTNLDMLLYSFSDKPLTLRPRVWRLDPGNYQIVLDQTDESGFTTIKKLEQRDITISSVGQVVEFQLPSQTPARLKITKKK